MHRSTIILSASVFLGLLASSAHAKDACYSRFTPGANPSADAALDRGTSAFTAGDYQAAAATWEMLAEQGDCRAQFNLGTSYLTGRGVVQDLPKALEWFRLSAEQGNARSQFNLAEGYRVGRAGVDKDMRQAISWYGKAADQGLKEAKAMLGLIYDRAPDFPRDPQKAAYFYREAAAQGDLPSCVNLGLMYAQGDGVAADKVLAYFFVSIAASSHLPAAEKTLPKLRAKMSAEQIEEAEQLAGAWKPSGVLPASSRTGLR
jgi:TPR repeat protein